MVNTRNYLRLASVWSIKLASYQFLPLWGNGTVRITVNNVVTGGAWERGFLSPKETTFPRPCSPMQDAMVKSTIANIP
jgi:hypothetical protein